MLLQLKWLKRRKYLNPQYRLGNIQDRRYNTIEAFPSHTTLPNFQSTKYRKQTRKIRLLLELIFLLQFIVKRTLTLHNSSPPPIHISRQHLFQTSFGYDRKMTILKRIARPSGGISIIYPFDNISNDFDGFTFRDNTYFLGILDQYYSSPQEK